MNSGRLDRRVTIERRDPAAMEFGHPADDAWSAVAVVWANIRPLSNRMGQENMQGMQLVGTVSHTVLVRYQPLLANPVETDAWRIRYENRIFNVLSSVTLEEGRRWVSFNCEEGTVSGD